MGNIKKDRKEYKTYDNTILIEGKKYRWSGYSEGHYVDTVWSFSRCKIRKIEGNKIFIYDYSDNKEWEFTNKSLRENRVTFKKGYLWIINL